MMASPTVSVILPCYNAHALLPRTLDSIRTQTFRDFEIIVVDDGSTDPETIAYLDALPNDIRLVRHENRGLAAARNTGFAHARGRYVLPLDCDDWIEPTFIEASLRALAAAPQCQYAYAHIALAGEASGTLVKHYNYFEQLFLNQLPYCILVERDTWAHHGGYDETMRQGYEDWEFNIRLGSHGAIGAEVPEPLFNYHVSRSGMLQSKSLHLHGMLWRDIQRKNAAAYRFGTLILRWRQWRRSPSTYPLIIYLPWLLMLRILPAWAFAFLFRRLLTYSHSRRKSAHQL
jgi:glycosyltransferase involved in cell wall biosynthesis